MNEGYVLLVDLGISLAGSLLGKLKDSQGVKVSQEVLDAGQAFIDALSAHKDDVITKAGFEQQRG